MENGMKAIALVLLLACLPAAAQEATVARTLEDTVRDYVELYRADTLAQWKQLFHPRLIVVFPDEGGSVVVRDLEQFYAAQASYLPTRKQVSERLENVRIDRGRRMARVSADFVFVDEGAESRGKLGLHVVEGADRWQIVGIVFSYDDEERKSVTAGASSSH
jgi:hypothetical protein